MTDAEITPVLRGGAHLFAGVLPGDMREMLIENLPPPAKEVESIKNTVDEVGETISDRTDSGDADTKDTDTGASTALDLRSDEGGN